MATVQDNNSLLLYRIGPVLCCAPSIQVQTIILPPSLTRPPGTSAAKPGIFKHAGHIVSTFDLRYKFGVEQSDWVQPGRLILTELAKGRVGFWVDEIMAVMEMPKEGWGSLPAGIPRGIFSRTLLFNDKIYLYADFEKLFTIRDHGYLKLYIQQLVEHHQTKQEIVAKIDTQANLSPASGNETPEKPKPTIADADAAEKNLSPQKSDPVAQRPVATSKKPVPTASRTDEKPAPIATKKPVIERAVVKKPVLQTETHASVNSVSEQNKAVKASTKESSHQTSASQDNPIIDEDRTSVNSVSTHKNKENSRGAFMFLSFVIILLGGTGFTLWYVLSPAKSILSYSKPADTIPAQAAYRTRDKDEPEDSQTDDATAGARQQTIEENQSPGLKRDQQKLQPDQKPSPKLAIATRDAAGSSSPDYRASIVPDEQGVTIILDVPALEVANSDPAFKLNEQENTQQMAEEVVTQTDAGMNKQDQKKTPVSLPAKRASQKVEIIHIVVKGDTLWHIAKKYVNNPYRYPELARLSKIKNPDLIYPGNRVRIIKRQHLSQ